MTGECQTCGSQYVDGKRVHDKYDEVPTEPCISDLQADIARLTREIEEVESSR